MTPFWICICLFFMVMVHFVPVDSIFVMSRIAVVVIMAFMTYSIASHIANAMTGVMTVFFCFLISFQRINDPALEMPVWLVLAFVMGLIYELCQKIKWHSERIPGGVTSTLLDLLPLVLMVITGTVLFFCGGPLLDVVRTCFAFLAGIVDSFPIVFLIVGGMSIFWTYGIHGDDLFAVVARPFWMYMSLCNFSAWSTGTALPFVTSESFFQWFISIGGTGATLGLVFDYLLFSKDKSFGLQTIKGGILNINEEVIFGLPIVNNRKMIMPFVAAPVLLSAIAYFAITKGMVYAPVAMMPWVLPAPLGALGACFLDYRAMILVVLNIVVSMVVYLPFVEREK